MKKKRGGKKDYIIGEFNNHESKKSKTDLKYEEVKLKDDKFPIENFVELYGYQNKNKIKLNTYKYPVTKGNIKGVVYLMYILYLLIQSWSI